MKNLRIVLSGLLLLGMNSIAEAQTEKGRLLLGGETKLNFNNQESEFKSGGDVVDMGSTTRFELSPKVGYFIAKGFAVGLEVPIETVSYPSSGSTSELYLKKEKGFAVMPFIRGYFGENNIKPFLEFKTGFGKKTQNVESYLENLEFEYSTFQYEFSGGIAVFLNKYVALDFGFGYSQQTSKLDDDAYTSFETTDSRIDLGIGLLIIL